MQIGLLLGVRNCGRSACRLVEYHHLGDEDLDVSDVRQTATYGERAKVLAGVAHIIKPLAEEVLFGRLKSGGHVRVIVIIEESGETKLGFVCGEGYGLSPRLARNHGGKCNPPGNGTDQSRSTSQRRM